MAPPKQWAVSYAPKAPCVIYQTISLPQGAHQQVCYRLQAFYEGQTKAAEWFDNPGPMVCYSREGKVCFDHRDVSGETRTCGRGYMLCGDIRQKWDFRDEVPQNPITYRKVLSEHLGFCLHPVRGLYFYVRLDGRRWQICLGGEPSEDIDMNLYPFPPEVSHPRRFRTRGGGSTRTLVAGMAAMTLSAPVLRSVKGRPFGRLPNAEREKLQKKLGVNGASAPSRCRQKTHIFMPHGRTRPSPEPYPRHGSPTPSPDRSLTSSPSPIRPLSIVIDDDVPHTLIHSPAKRSLGPHLLRQQSASSVESIRTPEKVTLHRKWQAKPESVQANRVSQISSSSQPHLRESKAVPGRSRSGGTPDGASSSQSRPICAGSSQPRPVSSGSGSRSRSISAGPSAQPRPVSAGSSSRSRSISAGPSAQSRPVSAGSSSRSRPISVGPSSQPRPVSAASSSHSRPISVGPSSQPRPVSASSSSHSRPISVGPSSQPRPIAAGPSQPRPISAGSSPHSRPLSAGSQSRPHSSSQSRPVSAGRGGRAPTEHHISMSCGKREVSDTANAPSVNFEALFQRVLAMQPDCGTVRCDVKRKPGVDYLAVQKELQDKIHRERQLRQSVVKHGLRWDAPLTEDSDSEYRDAEHDRAPNVAMICSY